jgi:hypothetical protein
MRPSTLRRISQLNTLVAVLSVRALPQAAIANLLECSASGARNYLRELIAAGLVDTVAHGHLDGRMYKSLYRIRQDAGRVDAPRFGLADTGECHPTPTTGSQVTGALFRHGACRARAVSPLSSSDSGAVSRDPLVSALFGKRTI